MCVVRPRLALLFQIDVEVAFVRESVPLVRIAQAVRVAFYSAPLAEPFPLVVVALLPVYVDPPHDATSL